MSAPLIVRQVVAYLDARILLDRYLRDLGEPGIGPLEGIGAIRARYRDALTRRARPRMTPLPQRNRGAAGAVHYVDNGGGEGGEA